MAKLKIKKGDNVVVTTGRDKGKTGEVLRVFPAQLRAIVQGINLAKRHTRPRMGDPGGIVEKELTIHISNIAHADPLYGDAARAAHVRVPRPPDYRGAAASTRFPRHLRQEL